MDGSNHLRRRAMGILRRRKTRGAEVAKKLRSAADTLDARSLANVASTTSCEGQAGKASERALMAAGVFKRAEKGSIKERAFSVTEISSNVRHC